MKDVKCNLKTIFILVFQISILFGCDDDRDEAKKQEFSEVSTKISGQWMWLLGSAITESNEIISYYSGEINDCNRVENLFFSSYIEVIPDLDNLEFKVSREDLCGSSPIATTWKVNTIDNGDGKINLTEYTSNQTINSFDLIYRIETDQQITLVVEQTSDFAGVNPKPRILGIYFYKIQ